MEHLPASANRDAIARLLSCCAACGGGLPRVTCGSRTRSAGVSRAGVEPCAQCRAEAGRTGRGHKSSRERRPPQSRVHSQARGSHLLNQHSQPWMDTSRLLGDGGSAVGHLALLAEHSRNSAMAMRLEGAAFPPDQRAHALRIGDGARNLIAVRHDVPVEAIVPGPSNRQRPASEISR